MEKNISIDVIIIGNLTEKIKDQTHQGAEDVETAERTKIEQEQE